MRINQYLSRAGIASRRKADILIEEGRVKINSEIANLGSIVSENDVVYFDNKVVKVLNEFSYYMLNKPVGIECTANRNVKNNIIDFIKMDIRVFPVGRLDKNSSGLLILTNDGDFANELMKGSNMHEKEYIVKVNKKIDDEFIKAMSSGVRILGRITRKCKVVKLSEYKFKIVLTQGWNRQIRRMCEQLGYNVVELRRVRIVNLNIGSLKIGEIKQIPESIVENMKKIIISKSS